MTVSSTITHKLDIPHEEGEWMEFKELGWRVLEIAREAKSRASLMSFRDLGPDFLKSFTSDTPEVEKKDAPDEPAVADPKDTYDMAILLRASIISWSYTVACNETNIDELDPRTATWAFDQIIKIHFPTEEEVGKVSRTLNVLSEETPPASQ